MDRLVFAALLGVSSIAVIELLQFSELDAALTVSLFCFSVALPLLATGIFLITLVNVYGFPREPLWFGALQAVGELAAVLGLGALIWHLHWLAGLVFAATSVAAFVACGIYAQAVGFYTRKDHPED